MLLIPFSLIPVVTSCTHEFRDDDDDDDDDDNNNNNNNNNNI